MTYSIKRIKKALGKNRMLKIKNISYSPAPTIEIDIKHGYNSPEDNTFIVCDADTEYYTFEEVINSLKYEIDQFKKPGQPGYQQSFGSKIIDKEEEKDDLIQSMIDGLARMPNTGPMPKAFWDQLKKEDQEEEELNNK